MTAVEEFRALELRCHTLLHDVPLHDVWPIDLDGGGDGRTMRDVDGIATPWGPGKPPPIARALLALRFAIGRVFRWDAPRPDSRGSYQERLTDDDRARSLVVPGTPRAIFRLLYMFSDEMLAEVRNATVHAFLVIALRPRRGGYRVYWAIYVKPVGRVTPIYMALIDPFRRFLVYPALIRHARAGWARAYGRA